MTTLVNRSASLDYLRGVMALAVLIFHYDKWLSGRWDASLPQGKLGVYAVSIFFVLSGLTLSIAYRGKLDWNLSSWKRFYLKRFWRIFPLLWLVTGCSLLIDDKPRTAETIFLNFSGLFGWVNPADDIATGAWSIGCELVYYAFFPLIWLLSQKSVWWLHGILAITGGIAAYLAFKGYGILWQDQEVWWPRYVQVLNHAVFFVAGIWIARFKWPVTVRMGRAVLAVVVMLFFGWSVSSNAFGLVYGYNRLVLSALVIIGVWLYVDMIPPGQGVFRQGLAWLGMISYALYLWHPVVFRGVQFVFRTTGMEPASSWIFSLALVLSLGWSHLSYHYFERRVLKRFSP